MARLIPTLFALGLLLAPLLALADVEVQKKPANVTPAQERAMNTKYARDRELAKDFEEKMNRTTPKRLQSGSSQAKHSDKPVAAQAGGDGPAEVKSHRKSQHGKIIEVSHHHRRQS